MKTIITLLTFLLIPLTSSNAQIITGGTDSFEDESYVVYNHKLKELEKHLISRDLACSTSERLLKSGDLVQTYLKLSLFKNRKATTEQCDDINKYFSCLNDDKTKLLVKKYVNNPKFIAKLTTNYKLSSEESKVIQEFYINLDNKIK